MCLWLSTTLPLAYTYRGSLTGPTGAPVIKLLIMKPCLQTVNHWHQIHFACWPQWVQLAHIQTPENKLLSTETRLNALAWPMTMTYDFELQSHASYRHDLLTRKSSRSMVSHCQRQSGNNRTTDTGNCINSLVNAVCKNRLRHLITLALSKAMWLLPAPRSCYQCQYQL